MNKAIRIIIISITLILSTLLINQLKYRNDELYAVNLKNKLDNDLVSILVSDGDSNYTKYEGSTFPSNTEYAYNSELSKCQDNNGNEIEGIISYNEESGKVNVRTKKTTSCYLYFDKLSSPIAEELIASGELWQSGLEGDGYRYIGSGNATASTSPNNFICFGTTSLSECKANESKYMYRIIGVFPDDAGEQHLKLIKKEPLSAPMTWDFSLNGSNWDSSTLSTELNGTAFLTNESYMPSSWSNKIVYWVWNTVNTLTIESSGPDYGNITTEQMYLHEMNRNSKKYSIGNWLYSEKKIGLIYASDYQMSLGSSSLSMTSSSNKAALKTSWMYISNNNTTIANENEWTISRYGYHSKYDQYFSWIVYSEGNVSWYYVYDECSVRPVFYLDSKVTVTDGTGVYSNPYLIKE